jgi:hypothetical protein
MTDPVRTGRRAERRSFLAGPLVYQLAKLGHKDRCWRLKKKVGGSQERALAEEPSLARELGSRSALRLY